MMNLEKTSCKSYDHIYVYERVLGWAVDKGLHGAHELAVREVKREKPLRMNRAPDTGHRGVSVSDVCVCVYVCLLCVCVCGRFEKVGHEMRVSGQV